MDTFNDGDYSSIVNFQTGNDTKFPLETLGAKDTKRETKHLKLNNFLIKSTIDYSTKRGTSWYNSSTIDTFFSKT